MRHAIRLTCPPHPVRRTALVLLLALGVACSGDEPPSDSGPVQMGLPDVTGDTGPFIDTGEPPVVPDPGATVNLTVWGEVDSGVYLPEEDAPVSVAGPDGAFLFGARTDVNGRVQLSEVPAGSSVSVVTERQRDTGFRGAVLHTVFGVEDGDDLILGFEDDGLSDVPGTLGVNVAANPALGSTGYHRVHVRCGGSNSAPFLPFTHPTLQLGETCQAGPINVLAVNYATASYRNAFGFAMGTAQASGRPLAGTATVSDWSSVHGTIHVLPPPDLVESERYVASVWGRFGEAFVSLAAGTAEDPSRDGLDALVSPLFDHTVVDRTLGNSYRFDVLSEIPAVGEARDVPVLRSDFLPPLDAPIVDADNVRPSLTFAGLSPDASCGTVRADALRGEVYTIRVVDRGLPTEFGAAVRWKFFGPVVDEVRLPELDPSQDAFWPTEGEVVIVKTEVSLLAMAGLDTAALRGETSPTGFASFTPSALRDDGCKSDYQDQ